MSALRLLSAMIFTLAARAWTVRFGERFHAIDEPFVAASGFDDDLGFAEWFEEVDDTNSEVPPYRLGLARVRNPKPQTLVRSISQQSHTPTCMEPTCPRSEF